MGRNSVAPWITPRPIASGAAKGAATAWAATWDNAATLNLDLRPGIVDRQLATGSCPGKRPARAPATIASSGGQHVPFLLSCALMRYAGMRNELTHAGRPSAATLVVSIHHQCTLCACVLPRERHAESRSPWEGCVMAQRERRETNGPVDTAMPLPETEERVSRRAIVKRALAFLAGALGAALLPAKAQAVDGDTVKVGQLARGSSTAAVVEVDNSAGGIGLRSYTDIAPAIYAKSTAGHGVYSQTDDGRGVWAISIHGPAVWAESSKNDGVHANSHEGTGVKAESAGGTALEVLGRASFLNAGTSTIAAGDRAATVSGVFHVGWNSGIVVTLMGNPGNGVYVKYTYRVSATSFAVVLNAPVTKTIKFAYFIFN